MLFHRSAKETRLKRRSYKAKSNSLVPEVRIARIAKRGSTKFSIGIPAASANYSIGSDGASPSTSIGWSAIVGWVMPVLAPFINIAAYIIQIPTIHVLLGNGVS